MTHRYRGLIGISMLAVAAASSSPAAAQTQAVVDGSPPAISSNLGRANGDRASATVNLTARYDSNVARLNDALPNARNLTQEDIRLSPSLDIDYARSFGRHQVGVQASLGYDFYTRNSVLDRERLTVAPFAALAAGPCGVNLQGLASRRQSDLGDLIAVGVDPAIGFDNAETRKRILGRLTCGQEYGLKPSFEAEYATGTNSNPLRRFANYSVTRVQPGVGYSSPGLGTITAFVFRSDTDLENQLLPDGRENGYHQTGVGVQYDRAIGTRLRFSGNVSHVRIVPRTGQLEPRSGLNYGASLTFLASDRLQLTGFANRAFTSTLTGVSTYELLQGYGLTANYAASDRLRLRLGGQVAPRSLFYAVTPTGPFLGEQTQYDIFGGASYTLNRRMRLNVDAGYQRRDADLNLFNYSSTFAAVGVSFSL